MALRPFSVRGEFSGRVTSIAGGPRLSREKASMDVDIFQRVHEEEMCICRVESRQVKRRLETTITLYPLDGSDPKQFVFTSRY